MSNLYNETNGDIDNLVNDPVQLNLKTCNACNVNYTDNTVNPDSQLCTKCREHYIKYPFPKWIFIIFIIIIGISIAGYMSFGNTLKDYINYERANKNYNDNYYVSAIRSYESLMGKYSNSQKIGVKLVDCYIETNNYEAAYNLIDKYFIGKDSDSESIYQRIEQAQELLGKFAATNSEIEKIFKDYKDEQDTIAKLTNMLNKDFDDSNILFNIAILKGNLGQYDKSLEDINNAYIKNPKYTWLLEYKSILQRRSNDIQGAISTCNEGLSKNKECVWAYRHLAVVDMLQNKNESALNNAQKAYELNNEYAFVTETLAIAYHVNGQIQERDKLLSEINEKATPTNSSLKDLIDGKITLEKYYN